MAESDPHALAAGLPEAERRYLAEVIARLGRTLGDDLVAAYLIGPASLGDDVPGSSDPARRRRAGR